MKYTVYFCTEVESIIDTVFPSRKPAIFEKLEDAKDYVESQTKGKQEYCSEDTDNGNNHFWYEIYEGEMIDEEGNLNDPVFESKYYYHQ